MGVTKRLFLEALRRSTILQTRTEKSQNTVYQLVPWQLKLHSGNACVWDLLSNALYMKGLNLKCIYVYRPVSPEVRRISLYNFARRCKRQRSLYKAEEKKSTIVMKVKKLFSAFRPVFAKWITYLGMTSLALLKWKSFL